jgi:hypothetical protein
VTTARTGGESTGESSAETAFASCREELSVEEVEQARVPQLRPTAAPVELGERYKEVRERGVLAMKER